MPTASADARFLAPFVKEVASTGQITPVLEGGAAAGLLAPKPGEEVATGLFDTEKE